MTNPTAPPDVVLPSVYPQLGSLNFNQQAYDAATSLPWAFVRQQEIAQATHTNAMSAAESAEAARSASLDAAMASSNTLSSANFKGLWTGLSGALNKPACVKHNGSFWLLLNNLADVRASQPGVSADWTSIYAASAVQEVDSNTSMLPWVHYVVKTAGITLTVPASVVPGSRFTASSAVNSHYFVNWAGRTVKGQVPQSPMRIPALRGFQLIYSGDTFV